MEIIGDLTIQSLLELVIESLKDNRSKADVSCVLTELDYLLKGTSVLEDALESIDNHDVICYTSPSGRSAFTVRSSLLRKSNNFSDQLSEESLMQRSTYTVFPDGPGYCTCFNFTNRVLMGNSTSTASFWRGNTEELSTVHIINDGNGCEVQLPVLDAVKQNSDISGMEHLTWCKHILTVKIARALGFYSKKDISDLSLLSILSGREV